MAMSEPLGFEWGPPALPLLLKTQLADHGFDPKDRGRCAQLLNAQPDSASAASLYVDLGALNFLAGDLDGAMAAWRHAILTQHDDAAARALLNLGLVYEHLHLYERAADVLESATERGVHPDAAWAAMARARCQRATGELDAAMETMARLAQAMMSEDPEAQELADTLYGLGDVASQAGRLDRAERAWQVAAAGPDSPAQQLATSRLIGLVLDQGHDDELLELLDRPSQGLRAGHAIALLDRVEFLHSSGEETKAIALVSHLEGQGLHVNERFRLAEVRLRVGLVNEAIDELEILLSAGSPEIHQQAAFALGELYRSHGMNEAAATMFQRVMGEGDQYWSPKATAALADLLADAGGGAVLVPPQHIASLDSDLVDPDPLALGSGIVAQSINVAESNDQAMSAVAEGQPVPEPIMISLADEQDYPLSSSVGPVQSDMGSPEVEEPLALVEPEIDIRPIVVDLNELEGMETVEPTVLDTLPEEPEAVIGFTEAVSTRDELSAEVPLSDLIADPKPAGSSFSSQLEGPAEGTAEQVPNPYASLAPDGQQDDDIVPSARNPYAELAPNYVVDDLAGSSDSEIADWESMLRTRPQQANDEEPAADPPSRPSAFSRYT